MASPLMAIPDHLMADIFLRLPTAEDLARTSAACVSFRRLVTDRSFLRRFRRLHAPPLLGFLDRDGFHPALPPHPSAPAARALAIAADFSFSFLPSHCRWIVQDVRDGRVLLRREPDPEEDERSPVSMELLVCDPLHRRYILLPQVPDDLASSLEHPVPMYWPWRDALLLPLVENEGAVAEETSFKVILLVNRATRLAAFVYSSSTTQWQSTGSKGWNDLSLGKGVSTTLSNLIILRHYYAYGCSYWNLCNLTNSEAEMLVLQLDTQRMEFSIAAFHGGCSLQDKVIVEAGEGRLGMFHINAETEYDLCYAIGRNKGESSSHWHKEKKISLDSGYEYSILAAIGRYLLLVREEDRPAAGSSPEMRVQEYFSMDVRTLQLEKVCAKQCARLPRVHIYTNFPPSLLSTRAI